MSYLDWTVLREELRPCRRAGRVDATERRLYSVIPCKHCGHEIVVASDSLRKHKKQAIDAHLGACPRFVGVRPKRRGRNPTGERPVLVAASPSQSVEVETMRKVVRVLCEEGRATLAKLDATTARLDVTLSVVSQHQLWWSEAAAALGCARAQYPPILLERIKELKEMLARTEGDPHGAMLDYQKSVASMLEQHTKTLEHRDRTIHEKTVLLEQKDALLETCRADLLGKESALRDARREYEEGRRRIAELEAQARAGLELQTSLTRRCERLERENEAVQERLLDEHRRKRHA